MANSYPLKAAGVTKYTGKSPSAVTDETAQYKEMLGTLAAGVDVGLFYQLNQSALAREQAEALNGTTTNDRTPLEANSVYV